MSPREVTKKNDKFYLHNFINQILSDYFTFCVKTELILGEIS